MSIINCMITEAFIDEYLRLDTDRDAGEGIWRLCEMSAEVVVPLGECHVPEKYKRKREDGDTKLLAHRARKNEDTIGRRAFAWRQWERFLQDKLYDPNGEELDYTHRQIRDRLFYSHFAELGKLVENGQIQTDTATWALVNAVENGLSAPRMIGEIGAILEVEEYFSQVTWPRFARRTRSMLKYPQISGRRRKLIMELSGTDWEAKESE